MHTYMHTCIQRYIHNIHAYRHTCIHTHMLTCRTYTHTYIHTVYVLTCIHTYIHAYIHTHMHTYIHAQTQAYIHASCVYFHFSVFCHSPGHHSVYLSPLYLNSYGQDAWDDPHGISDEAAGDHRQHDGHEEEHGSVARAVGVGAEG